jgi:hypothetical protein
MLKVGFSVLSMKDFVDIYVASKTVPMPKLVALMLVKHIKAAGHLILSAMLGNLYLVFEDY